MSGAIGEKVGQDEGPVQVLNSQGQSAVLLVCEHASNYFPLGFANLGLDKEARHSHVAWDPGAFEVAARLSDRLDATLVAGGVSRLIYDCNRAKGAPDATPAKVEMYDIPGNVGIGSEEIGRRYRLYYEPFNRALDLELHAKSQPRVIVTIHSFTQLYFGKPRGVEIGILHDEDSRMADALLGVANKHTPMNVQRNEPYGAEDGVTHTLIQHGVRNGLQNVMLEIRNDLIATSGQQDAMAEVLAGMLTDAVAAIQSPAMRASQ